MSTQRQLFYQAQRDIATVNADFLWLVEYGMTKQELEKNIARHPSLWSRFAAFLNTLPNAEN